jgi:DNA-binding SARP family transcriptional activator/tetratricopeptide (TPR) repeat protein
MQVRLLGPVELWDGRAPVPIGPRARAVLAALALTPGQVHSVDRLIEAVWGQDPPTTATAQIQACVSSLRRAWPGGSEASREVLVTAAPGYVLRTDRIDVVEFDRRVAQARDRRADQAAAASELRAALAMWRGPALGGLPGLTVEATRLEERRLHALEERIAADLSLGRHSDLISEVAVLVAEHPLRERFRGQLMLALHQAGRRFEALDAYQDARRTLIEELGLEPGPELRRIQQAVLTDDFSAASATVARDEPAPLPADIADFTGRTDQIDEVMDAVSWNPDRAVPIVTITGRGGIGKTTLAVHVAHRLRRRFPDGRLYVDLNGTHGDPSATLGRLLRGFGSTALPDGLQERAELFRARLDGRRVLVVLDNAASEAQVRPLLPGSGTCAVLITSRRHLTGIAGAVRVELDAFEPAQATELIGRVIGQGRLAAEPAAAARIVQLCDRLPLALRIAAARLAAKPHWTLDGLSRRLADEHRRLDELTHADLEVRGSIAVSHRDLSPAARRVFGLLGLLEVPDFAAWTAGALLDIPVDRGEDLIEELLDARLLVVTPGGRFGFHDLVRVYAKERASADESAAERQAALCRAFATWLALATTAEERLANPYYSPLYGDAPRRPVEVEIGDPRGWFDAEHGALKAVVGQAASHGMPGVCWELAGAVWPFFELSGDLTGWRRCCEEALAAARAAGDVRGEAASLINLGALLHVQSRFADARRTFEQAAELCVRIGADYGRAGALCGVAAATRITGDPSAARLLWRKGQRIFGVLGDLRAQAYATEGLGLCDLDQGRLLDARERFEEMLALHQSAGNIVGEAHALRRLATVELDTGSYDVALGLLKKALPTFRSIGDRLSEAVVQMRLGECLLRQGHHVQAGRLLDQAMIIFKEVGWHTCEAHVLRLSGEMLLADGEPGAAVPVLEESVAIFRDLEESLDLAESLVSLGRARIATGDAGAAGRAEGEAAKILAELGREI